ncbi:MAG: lasso peptide biosynthesis B2 protein [Anaerolineales bacterium]|nr:lasso peptide biosynthesis B2 protein [Anaerolineales bacterium]
MRPARNLLRRPPADWWLLLWVGGLLLLVRLGLALLAFRRVRRLIGRFGRVPAGRAPAPEAALARLAWAVERMARFVVADRPCLTQALALQLLFARRGCETELRIGVAKEPDGRLLAHAWVERDGHVVIGGADSPRRFTPLPSFQDIGL